METQLTLLLQLKCCSIPLLLYFREVEKKIKDSYIHTYTHKASMITQNSLTDGLSVQYKDMVYTQSTTDML